MIFFRSFKSLMGMLMAFSPYYISTSVEASWSTPATISSGISDQPDLAVDISGNAVLVWQEFDGFNYLIKSSILPYGGSWSTPTAISGIGINPQGPEICVDSSGNGVAIWSIYNGTNSVIESATLPFNGSWTAPVAISANGANADSPELAMESTGIIGNAVAVWHRFNGSNFVVQASTLLSGGTWSIPIDITPSGQDALIPEIAVDPSGNAVFACCRFDGNVFTTRSSTLLFNQNWSPSSLLSTPGSTVNQPVVAIDSLGNAMVICSQFDGTNFVIEVSTQPFGGSWSSSVNISASGEDAYIPKIALDHLGNAVAAWIRYDGSNYIAQASTLPFGGSWSTPVNLSIAGQDVGNIYLKVDTSGNAIAIWDITDGISSIVQSSRLPLNGTWSGPVDVSTPGNYAYLPVLDVDGSGNAVAVWLESDGTMYVLKGATLPAGG